MAVEREKADEIQNRLINFGARISRVAKMLPRIEEGRYISQQLMRSGLAAAPNYAEATAAESRADFLHKLRIVLKELNETKSWIEQIVANSLFSRDKISAIIAENQELRWIIAASIKTARRSGSPNRNVRPCRRLPAPAALGRPSGYRRCGQQQWQDREDSELNRALSHGRPLSTFLRRLLKHKPQRKLHDSWVAGSSHRGSQNAPEVCDIR